MRLRLATLGLFAACTPLAGAQQPTAVAGEAALARACELTKGFYTVRLRATGAGARAAVKFIQLIVR